MNVPAGGKMLRLRSCLYHDDEIARTLFVRLINEACGGTDYVPADAHAICWLNKEGKIAGGVAYFGYRHGTIECAVAVGDKASVSRDQISQCFAYPFGQLGVNRVQFLVPKSAKPTRALALKLGFVEEATLKAAFNGENIIVYRMTRDEYESSKWSRNG